MVFKELVASRSYLFVLSPEENSPLRDAEYPLALLG